MANMIPNFLQKGEVTTASAQRPSCVNQVTGNMKVKFIILLIQSLRKLYSLITYFMCTYDRTYKFWHLQLKYSIYRMHDIGINFKKMTNPNITLPFADVVSRSPDTWSYCTISLTKYPKEELPSAYISV